jgi:thiol:disulfide interchange protein
MRLAMNISAAAICLIGLAFVIVVAGCERKTQRYNVTIARTVDSTDQCVAVTDATPNPTDSVEMVSFYTVAKYDPEREPAVDLALSLHVAQETKKRILLQVGGEWCGWCHKLDAYIAEHSAVSSAINDSFVIMKVNYSDENKNEAFLSQYPQIPGYPHLYVLESDGTLLHSQNTVELEERSSYNEAALLAFVERWKPK